MATYYIAPIESSGNDTNPGTLEQPWATLTKAISVLVAGDTVFIRGGTYNITAYQGISFSGAASGTAVNPICYYNYPGETPVFDGTGQSSGGYPKGFNNIGCSYVKFKGLVIKNIINATNTANGIYLNGNANNLTFENVKVENIRGIGFQVSGDNNHFINCDAESCADIELGGGDGWQVASYEEDLYTYFSGCRAMYCSDDGWDNFWNDGVVEYNSCWAINCGINKTTGSWYGTGAAGNGFKLGRNLNAASGKTQRILNNCIAASNFGAGFTENNNPLGDQIEMEIFNNLAYDNSIGFMNIGTATTNYYATYRNNIAYDNIDNTHWYAPSKVIQDHNSWNAGMPTVSDIDFINLDVSQLHRDRKSDGSLPDVSFGHLATGSDIIYEGVWVDVSLDGEGDPWHNPPSLGAFEYDASIDVSTSVPTVTTTAITDISTATATGGGNVTHDGSLALTYKGICWSTSANPTVTDSSTQSGSTGEGSYVSYLTGLNSSTHYHVRAFAYNSVGIAYGIDVSFNTLYIATSTSAPTVTTTAITNISASTAIGGGNVTHDGSIALTYRGICWSTSINPTVTDASTTDSSTGEGSYTLSILGDSSILGDTSIYSSASNLRYRRAVPITTIESGNIQSISFYHDGCSGDVLLGIYSDVNNEPSARIGLTASTALNASIGWQTVSFINPVEVSSGNTVWLAFVYEISSNLGIRFGEGTTPRAITTATWTQGMPETFGPATYYNYSYSVYCTYTTGLEASTHYHVRAFAYNSVGIAYGIDVSFNTTSVISAPTVTTSAITNISASTAIGGGNVTHDGSIALTYRGICWSTLENPTVTDASTTDSSTGEGSYTLSILGDSSILGDTSIYSSASTSLNRRAVLATASESGTIQSISIYHSGNANGNALLGIYSDASDPSVLLGVTASTSTNISEGWQTIPLISPVEVSSGSKIWIAFVFDVDPFVRWRSTASGGTGLRAKSSDIWTQGMPETFGAVLSYTISNYSVYCTYTTGLESSTHYHVRAFAYNSVGTAYGIDVSFNTLSETTPTSVPTVTTTAITDISTATATGGGNVTHDGSVALTYKGICWSTSANPTVLDTSTQSGSTGEGSYVSYLTGLNSSTHYHVRAFAYNSVGISYGIDVSFNTTFKILTDVSDRYLILSTHKYLTIDGKYLVI